MASAKKDFFSPSQNRQAELAKALGHPARIAILECLLDKQSCVCGEIVDELPLSQSTVSQHLKELKKAGLIQGTISGPSTCYCINEEVWKEARMIFNAFLNKDVKQMCC